MDPLQRLEQKNKQHAKLIAKERNQALLFLPLAIITWVVYGAFFLFLMDHQGQVLGSRLLGATKQVWWLTMVVIVGLGALFFSGSLALSILASMYAKHVERRVNSPMVILCSGILLGVSSVFFTIAKWFDELIIANNKSIAMFFHTDYDNTPFLISFGLTLIVVYVAFTLTTVISLILALPFKAKKQFKDLQQ